MSNIFSYKASHRPTCISGACSTSLFGEGAWDRWGALGSPCLRLVGGRGFLFGHWNTCHQKLEGTGFVILKSSTATWVICVACMRRWFTSPLQVRRGEMEPLYAQLDWFLLHVVHKEKVYFIRVILILWVYTRFWCSSHGNDKEITQLLCHMPYDMYGHRKT